LWSEGEAGDSQVHRFAVQGVYLFHGIMRLHSVAATVEAIMWLKSELLPHPAYSLDLAPSDYHMFGPLKEALCEQGFASGDEVKDMVHMWLDHNQKLSSQMDQKACEQLHNVCLKMGDYVDK
jgi:hypothetical protein